MCKLCLCQYLVKSLQNVLSTRTVDKTSVGVTFYAIWIQKGRIKVADITNGLSIAVTIMHSLVVTRNFRKYL